MEEGNMLKKLIPLMLLIMLSSTVMSATLTRTIPSQIDGGEIFDVTYTASNLPQGDWAVVWTESVEGCMPSIYEDFMMSGYTASEITVQYTAPFSGTCRFFGDYEFIDEQPQTFESVTVQIGIIDTDNDGIEDINDDCPSVAENYNDYQDDDGCPDVPVTTTPNGESGSVIFVDSDEDGIVDKIDLCPDTRAGTTVGPNGCPLNIQKDADRDGVQDSDDLCGSTPNAEPADLNGCSDSQKDTDGDGINDRTDICKNDQGPKENSGCPLEAKETNFVIIFTIVAVIALWIGIYWYFFNKNKK
jgi:hypothetical protein